MLTIAALSAAARIEILAAVCVGTWLLVSVGTAHYGANRGFRFWPLVICSLFLGFPLVLLAVTIGAPVLSALRSSADDADREYAGIEYS